MPAFARLATLFLITALGVTAQSFAGIYSNKDLRLELKEAAANAYTGTLALEGQSYPVKASGGPNQLTGQFTVNGNTFPFTARLDGNRLTLNSAQVDHTLLRESGTASRHTHPSGFSFTLAPGWTATNNPEGVVILPPGATFDTKANDNPEVYIAIVKDGYTPAEEAKLVQQLSTAFTQGAVTIQRSAARQPASFGPRAGSIYRWDFRDNQTGRNLGFDLFGAPDGSRIFVFISVGLADRIRPREPEVVKMLSSMSYQAPPSGPLSDSTPLAQQWVNKLKGRMIRQMYAYSGMSSDKYHYINADGTYRYRSSSMVAVDVPGASALGTGNNATTGRWKIRDINGQIFLEVQYQSGETVRMPIRQDERNWYLNGEKAFAVDPQ